MPKFISESLYQFHVDQKLVDLVNIITCASDVSWQEGKLETYLPTKRHWSGYVFMSADLSVSWHYVVTLRRGRTRTREQLLLQNYKA